MLFCVILQFKLITSQSVPGSPYTERQTLDGSWDWVVAKESGGPTAAVAAGPTGVCRPGQTA